MKSSGSGSTIDSLARHSQNGRGTLASSPSGPHVHLTPASEIFIRPVRWLWTNRLALGSMGLLGGREGLGKSIFLYTLAADITKGRLPGVFAGTPRAVVIAATEDSWEFTVVPRLMAADANLDLVFRVDVTTATGLETGLSLPRDLRGLETVVTDVQAALVILDPLMSRLDTQLDTHKDGEVRLALEPLVALADKVGVTVVGIIHVNKSASSDALTMLMGSRAFAAVARSVLFVMADPDDDQTRLLGQPKNNLGRLDLPTLKFTITGVKVADTLEGPVWTGKLVWTGETERSIRDALESAVEASIDKTATSEAQAWLEDYLTSKDGSAESATVKREGLKQGHSKDALRRACHRLGVSVITTGFPRRSVWTLPISARAGRCQSTASTAATAPGRETDHSYIHHLASIDAVDAVNAMNAIPQEGSSTEDRRSLTDQIQDRGDALFRKGWGDESGEGWDA
jgi:hypothetical protein